MSTILFGNILPQKIIIKHPNNKKDITKKNCHIINPSSLYDMEASYHTYDRKEKKRK